MTRDDALGEAAARGVYVTRHVTGGQRSLIAIRTGGEVLAELYVPRAFDLNRAFGLLEQVLNTMDPACPARPALTLSFGGPSSAARRRTARPPLGIVRADARGRP